MISVIELSEYTYVYSSTRGFLFGAYALRTEAARTFAALRALSAFFSTNSA
jgi:hypothetical protein